MKRQIIWRKKELGIETILVHCVVKLRNADAKIVALAGMKRGFITVTERQGRNRSIYSVMQIL